MASVKIKWVDNHLKISPPKRFKKLTGTRFAAVLGLNKWSTPFEIWCAVTKTYEKPFEDTIYTIAGKTIEPKQAEYMKRAYAMYNLTTPTDVFGADYFKTTYGDFFHEINVFGGMWDYLLVDENNRPTTVLEMKTTKRAEDWQDDIPEYYALQAAMYAYLLEVDDVIMVCTVLNTKDYDDPASFEVSSSNTFTRSFKVSERYPDFAEKLQNAMSWWNTYVVTGISPDYDEIKDAEILKALRTNTVSDDNLDVLIEEAESLKAELDAHADAIAEKEKRYKLITGEIKEQLACQFRDGDDHVTATGKNFSFELGKSETVKIDESALEADGLLEKYKTKRSTNYKMNVKKLK